MFKCFLNTVLKNFTSLYPTNSAISATFLSVLTSRRQLCSTLFSANGFERGFPHILFEFFTQIRQAKIQLIAHLGRKHRIELTLYGNRYKTLAALHNADTPLTYSGPYMWYGQEDIWCYEYKMKDTEIMVSTVLEIYR